MQPLGRLKVRAAYPSSRSKKLLVVTTEGADVFVEALLEKKRGGAVGVAPSKRKGAAQGRRSSESGLALICVAWDLAAYFLCADMKINKYYY